MQAVDASAIPPPTAATEARPAGVLGLLAMCLAVLLAIVAAVVASRAYAGPHASAEGYLIGTLLGALGFPFMIAYLAAGRRKSRNPRAFAWIFSAITVLFAFGSLTSNIGSIKAETGEQMAGRLMREAAGLQPIHQSLFSGRRKMEDGLRAQFKKMVDVNKDYMEKVGQLDTSAVSELNSSKSFVQPEVGDLALKQIHAVYDLDVAQEQRLAQIISDLRKVLDSTASSESERVEMEKGFDRGMQEAMTKRSTTVAAEKAWVESLDEEYQYARAHQASLREADGRVVIQGHEIVLEFNRRMRQQETQRKEFVKLQQEFTQFQADTLRKAGLKPEDIGRK